MAGLVLSRRLQAFHDSLGNLGKTVAGIGEANRREKLEEEEAKRKSELFGLQKTQLGQANELGSLQLSTARRAETEAAGRDQARDLLGQIGSAVPATSIGVPEGGLPGFSLAQSPARPAEADQATQDLRDTLMARYKGMTKEEYQAAKKSAEEERARKEREGALEARKINAQAERDLAAAAESRARATAGPGAKPPRDLSDGGIKTLNDQASKLLQVHDLYTTFKPDYVGFGEGVKTTLGKLTGTNADQVQWWQGYQSMVNEVRNAQFGASLTPPEKKEFEKTIITPNMSAKVAEANLQRQFDILRGASERQANTYAAGNVNREQIRAAYGESYDPESGKISLPGRGGARLEDLSDEELDAQLRAKGIDPQTGRPMAPYRGRGASGSF